MYIWGGGKSNIKWLLLINNNVLNKLWFYSNKSNISCLNYPCNLYFLNINYTYYWEKINFCRILKNNIWFSSLKISFKRKGSWMFLKRSWPRYITSKVGYSHPKRVESFNLLYSRRKKHLQRHTLTILSNSWFIVKNKAKIIINWRYFGCYTKRGIRMAREDFFKRQGKISQYKHLKSKIF